MSFNTDVSSFFAQVRVAAQEAAAGMAHVALEEILEASPQFSGQFVANWQLTPYTPSFVAYDDPMHFEEKNMGSMMGMGGGAEPYEKGDTPAIDFALERAAKGLVRARAAPLGTSIFLSNSSTHDEPYAWKIENGEISFRPENPNADRVVQRGAFFVRNRYKHINGNKLDALRKVGK